jgi:peptidyl-prolyl cis-trans isomerase C
MIRCAGMTVLFLSAGLSFGQGTAKAPAQGSKPAAAAPAKVRQDSPPGGQAEISSDETIPPQAPDAIFPAVVARVNGKAILGRDLEQRVRSELAPIGTPSWKNLREDYRAQLTGQSLRSLIATELLYQKAVSMGFAAADTEVQAEFDKAAKSFSSDAEMNTALAARGMDRILLKKQLARDLLVFKFIDATITKKIVIAPSDLSQYYAGHVDQFRHPDMVRTSHILIAVAERATPQQDQAAKQRAEAVLARLKRGENFAKLAKDNSIDASAAKGGDIGFYKKGDLDPQYEAAASSLPVGQITGPIRSRYGYHIIKVTDKKKEGLATLEEIRAELTDFLKQQKGEEELNKLVEELRKQAKIEVLIKSGV